MKIAVNIKLKEGVLDPQGKAINHALHTLGFNEVMNVRVGKRIELDINTNSKETAAEEVKKMCETLFANTVIEDYEIE